ncbi:MAG TPA: hypothetical protein VF796_16005, partial [Humisphaera sp.]
SIGAKDVVVEGPGGPLKVTGVTSVITGGHYVATYRFAAPGGSWDAADNGAYAVRLAAGQVRDAQGLGVAALASGFDVSIAAPRPVVDTGFSGGTAVGSGFVAEAAVTLDDGRIVLAGRRGNLAAGTSQGVLKRLNPDGSLDASFGDGGTVVTEAGANRAFYALTLLPDGSLVAAGTGDGDLLVQKFKASGAADGRFGQSGRAVADFGQADDAAYGVAVAADGGIVAGGSSGGSFAFAKFTADGAVDRFFGTLGMSLFALGSTPGQNAIGGVSVQPDGRIVGVGAAGDDKVAVLRLTADGDADPSFGTNGAAVLAGVATRTDLGTADHTVGVALQDDGRILLTNRAGSDFAVARLNADGSPDRSFGTNGTATVDFGGDDDADALVVRGTGEILVVGTTTAGGGRTAVAALHADGTLNEQFGDAGRFTADTGISDPGRALHVGNLVMRAFAAAGSGGNGGLVVGTSDGAVNATSSSGLRRLNVPGSGLIGRVGAQDGKSRKVRFVDVDGTVVTISVKGGGTGQVFGDGANVDLVLSGTTAKTTLSISARGGDGRFTLRDVSADGPLKSVSAKAVELAGTFWAGGDVGKAAFARLTGTFAAAGSIGTLSVGGDVTGAKVLAGANLGADHKLGGTAA